VGGVVGEVVEELAARGGGGNGGVGEDLREGEAEDGDGVDLEGVFEVALVEDVALAVLNEEEDAGRVAKGGFAISMEGGTEAGREPFGALVGWELER
jgi:hypothetical protein